MNISALSNNSYTSTRAYSTSQKAVSSADASRADAMSRKPLDDDLAAQGNPSLQKSASSADSTSTSRVRYEESFGAYDYAKLYDPNATFDFPGQDATAIDAAGTLGKLRKDELMGQYRNLMKETAYRLRPTENFTM